jgi:hypothetical protein
MIEDNGTEQVTTGEEESPHSCALRDYCDQHSTNMDDLKTLNGLVNQHKGQWLVLLGFASIIVIFCAWMGGKVTKMDNVVTSAINVTKVRMDTFEEKCLETRSQLMLNTNNITELQYRVRDLERNHPIRQ